MKSTDESELDQRYFVTSDTYNCPYCKRRHVGFYGPARVQFDWDSGQKVTVLIVSCRSCDRRSAHFAKGALPIADLGGGRWSFNSDVDGASIDSLFFLSVPSSRFVLDDRIPREFRDLFAEASECLGGNLLTGASACVRKLVYEIAKREGADGADYVARIKSLKQKLPTVDPSYFDTLAMVHELTSNKVHENAYDGWDGKHIRVMLTCLQMVLQEVYVIPALRRARLDAVTELKAQLQRPARHDGAGPKQQV
jgi:hypothetical protein